jgi:hypothetical protein
MVTTLHQVFPHSLAVTPFTDQSNDVVTKEESLYSALQGSFFSMAIITQFKKV